MSWHNLEHSCGAFIYQLRPIVGTTTMWIYTILTHIVILFTGIYAAIAQIPSLNPYRWPGWFLAALGLLIAAIVMLFFTEPRPWACRAKSNLCSCKPGLELSLKLKTRAKTRVIVSFA